MKNLFILGVLFTFFAAFATTDPKDAPKKPNYSKIITVHGMVCASCSNKLKTKFKTEEAVDQIKVDRATKKVSILFKKGKTIKDEQLKDIVTASGFKFVKVESPSGSEKTMTK